MVDCAALYTSILNRVFKIPSYFKQENVHICLITLEQYLIVNDFEKEIKTMMGSSSQMEIGESISLSFLCYYVSSGII